jgi:dephospho-CoA kinase
MIIHIAGSSGSGKSYIGNIFKNNMNVIDTDDWTEEYGKIIKNKTKKSFINFIQNKINNLDINKINLLVGYLDFYIKNIINVLKDL